MVIRRDFRRCSEEDRSPVPGRGPGRGPCRGPGRGPFASLATPAGCGLRGESPRSFTPGRAMDTCESEKAGDALSITPTPSPHQRQCPMTQKEKTRHSGQPKHRVSWGSCSGRSTRGSAPRLGSLIRVARTLAALPASPSHLPQFLAERPSRPLPGKRGHTTLRSRKGPGCTPRKIRVGVGSPRTRFTHQPTANQPSSAFWIRHRRRASSAGVKRHGCRTRS